VNQAAYFVGVPLRLHVPEFRTASTGEFPGKRVELGFVRPAFRIKYIRAPKVRLISVQGGVS
jgi:hypothetical protein